MSANEPPIHDAALLALLRFDAERDSHPAAKARVLGRLATTTGAIGVKETPTSSARLDGEDHSSTGNSALLSDLRAAGTRRSSLRATWGLVGKPLRTIAVAFLLGGAGGVGFHAAFAPNREHTVYLEHPIAVPEPRPFAFDVPNRVAESTRDTDAPESPKGRSNPTPVVSALTAERALLDRARKALARGDTPEAESALDLHARRHPAGLLVEEREALAIKVLVDLGRAEEAHRRAAKFNERYPRSLFGPAVNEAVGTIR